jgi:hypothetical protein
VLSHKFDVITNIGFTEHVGEGDIKENVYRHQYTIFKSIHDLGKVGSLFYHDFMVTVPAHGVVNYRLPFIYALAKANQYSHYFEPYRHSHNWNGDTTVYLAAYRKEQNNLFMTFEEFLALPGLVPVYDTYGKSRTAYIYLTDTKGVSHMVMYVDQDFDLDISWVDHATVLCNDYFTTTPAADNLYLLNDRNCMDHIAGSLSNINIEKYIAS